MTRINPFLIRFGDLAAKLDPSAHDGSEKLACSVEVDGNNGRAESGESADTDLDAARSTAGSLPLRHLTHTKPVGIISWLAGDEYVPRRGITSDRTPLY